MYSISSFTRLTAGLITIVFSLVTLASDNLPSADHTLLPIVNYYDCSPVNLNYGILNYVEGVNFEVISRKSTESYLKGSEFSVVTDSNNEFYGLSVKLFEDSSDDNNGLFFNPEQLTHKIYIESNETSFGITLREYHLPVYTFGICEGTQPQPGLACIEIGYLKSFNPLTEVIKESLVNRWGFSSKDLNETSLLEENYLQAVSEGTSKWGTFQLFIEWGNDERTYTYTVDKQGREVAIDTLLGQLKTKGSEFSGTSHISYALLNEEDSNYSEFSPQLSQLLDDNNCQSP